MKTVSLSLSDWLRQIVWPEQDRRNPSEVVHRIKRAHKVGAINSYTKNEAIKLARRG